MLGAEEFIPVAEETGMIVPIGDRIINDACRALARWQRSPHATDRLCVHVNVSRLQLLLPDLVNVVAQALAEHAIPAECLHLEVTERVIMDDPAKIVARLNELRQKGVKIDIDGFGTGYSSLSCLHEFPIDYLKIDPSFIANVKETPELAALLTAVLSLADQLGLRVVAAGIEDSGQATMLRALGCQYGQGYLFAKPMSAEAVAGFVGAPVRTRPAESGAAKNITKSCLDAQGAGANPTV